MNELSKCVVMAWRVWIKGGRETSCFSGKAGSGGALISLCFPLSPRPIALHPPVHTQTFTPRPCC